MTTRKVHIIGVTTIDEARVFVLEYLQCRDANLVRRPFFAKFDPRVTWYDQLQPVRESDRPFFPKLKQHEMAPTVSLTVSNGTNGKNGAN